jgi:hypothetical protein
MKLSAILFIFLSAASLAAAAAPPIFVCQVTERFLCIGDTCQEIPLGSWTIINLAKRTLTRCNFEGCDTYNVHISHKVGESTVLENLAQRLQAVLHDDLSFSEKLTLQNHGFVSIGNCRPQP